ncbi:hypothetical protein [Ktedonobacter robiniae]|uniref:Glycosyltransferase RgtA/B/C/D-like domain-containing protein n=1 Tax=Ktedonobacter robiniae TaxID=2778365 RepID=A0ABQ3V2L2_9CHLR|nr:hypothetical protein [Ktedonobacter robiniae]GHO59163.1 hypothetical protein KSB_76380 [Ktedonobacter robiniae]
MNKGITISQAQSGLKIPLLIDIVCLLLPLGAFVLWYSSLGNVAINIPRMNDLGLVSIMPPTLIIALLIMMVSFCLTLQQPRLRTPIVLLHFALLIFMLYALCILVEEAPRFAIVYRHAGYTEYIMRTGSVDPGLDAYFSWPGFFILSAFVTRISGYPDILGYASWAPVFYNVLYLGALYMLFSTFTSNKRLIYLALWFFCITNWIGQDYFSPQGFFFFSYIVILAIILKWFKAPPGTPIRPLGSRLSRIRFLPQVYTWLTAPDSLNTPAISRAKSIALLISMLTIFAFSVYGHQLTPFFIVASVTGLIVFRRCTPKIWWLPIAMVIMIGAWLILMTQSFLSGHMSQVFGGIVDIFSSVSSNVSNRVGGSPQHTFIARLRLIMTAFVWGLAGIGAIFRLLKGHKDASIIILALAPFPLFMIQPYGGEMLLRCYLFALPPMVFLAASIFYELPTLPTFLAFLSPLVSRLTALLATIKFPWRGIAIAGINIILLSSFLYTRYGNENMDYKTYDEINGVYKLYSIAQPGSLLVAGWDGTPWQIKDFEKYPLTSLDSTDKLGDAVYNLNVAYVVQYMQNQKGQRNQQIYFIFTRSQKAWFNSMSGFPPGALDKFENAVASSGDFNLVYRSQDVQIFQLASAAGGKL